MIINRKIILCLPTSDKCQTPYIFLLLFCKWLKKRSRTVGASGVRLFAVARVYRLGCGRGAGPCSGLWLGWETIRQVLLRFRPRGSFVKPLPGRALPSSPDRPALRGPFLRSGRVWALDDGKLPPRGPVCVTGQIWGVTGRGRHCGLGWETIRQDALACLQSREFSEALTRKGAAEQPGQARLAWAFSRSGRKPPEC